MIAYYLHDAVWPPSRSMSHLSPSFGGAVYDLGAMPSSSVPVLAAVLIEVAERKHGIVAADGHAIELELDCERAAPLRLGGDVATSRGRARRRSGRKWFVSTPRSCRFGIIPSRQMQTCPVTDRTEVRELLALIDRVEFHDETKPFKQVVRGAADDRTD